MTPSNKTGIEALRHFLALQGRHRNTWIRFTPAHGVMYDLYFRYSSRFFDTTKWDRVLDLANSSCNLPGSGYYAGIMESIETLAGEMGMSAIYLENVMGDSEATGDRLLGFYVRRGYMLLENFADPNKVAPCLWKPMQ